MKEDIYLIRWLRGMYLNKRDLFLVNIRESVEVFYNKSAFVRSHKIRPNMSALFLSQLKTLT